MLVVMILMLGMTLAGMNPVIKSANPLASLGGFLVLMCIITTIAMAIPLGLLYKPRTWCSFCPVGYIQSIISKKRLLKLKVENCVDCRKCERECPIELNATQGSSDCFNCMQCVDICNKKSIKPVISLE
jgi:polyferredoxin